VSVGELVRECVCVCKAVLMSRDMCAAPSSMLGMAQSEAHAHVCVCACPSVCCAPPHWRLGKAAPVNLDPVAWAARHACINNLIPPLLPLHRLLHRSGRG